MRIALLIEGGHKQIVLTAESPQEALILKTMEGSSVAEITWGSFYHCRGGFMREGEDADSAIIVLSQK